MQFIGTPAYMSPEQAEITSVDVDTRSDIYLRERIGDVHQALADYPAAEQTQRRVLALRRQLYPDGHRYLAKALNDLAMTLMYQGRLPEAESLSRGVF